ncbi:MAG: L-histidine N(alpha)-methyltransferase [Terriglobales bacterium]
MAQALLQPGLARTLDSGMLHAVEAGLLREGQKRLTSTYLYDEVGSLLFEAICALPEYGLTEADERLLSANASAMVAPFAAGVMVAELGSGSARKTRWVLRALCRRQATRYWPIEISPLALERSQRELAAIAQLTVTPLALDYLQGLNTIAQRRAEPGLSRQPLLVLFLGSTLGNFDPPRAAAFLRAVRALLRPGDGLLLGLDLVKPAALLKLAYDDPAGVTAAFNKNLLARLNRDLGMDFNLAHWQHRALYRSREHRVEMHLRARRRTQVSLPAGEVVAFARGETIWTESSHKFRLNDIAGMLSAAGFRTERQWVDAAWPFAETLALVN